MVTNKKPITTLLAVLAVLALQASRGSSAAGAVAAAATATELYLAQPEPMADLNLHRAMSAQKLVRRSESRGGTNPALERSQPSTTFTQTDCRVRWTDACSNGTGSGGYANGGYNPGFNSGYPNGYQNGGSSGVNSRSSEDRERRPSEQSTSSHHSSSSDDDERRSKRHIVASEREGGVRRRHLGRRMDFDQLDRRYVPMSGGIGSQFPKESAQGR